MTEEILNEGILNVPQIATEYSDGELDSPHRAEGSSAEPNNSFETAYDLGTLSNPLTLENLSISPATDEDYFKFTLSNEQILQITTSGVSGGDTVMYLYNSDHKQIGYNDDFQSYYSKVVASLEAGTYYIKIQTYQNRSTISNYALKLEEFEVTDTTLDGESQATRCCLCVYQFVVDNFGGAVADVVHPADPFELVIGFELFGDALADFHLIDQLRK